MILEYCKSRRKAEKELLLWRLFFFPDGNKKFSISQLKDGRWVVLEV